MTTIEPSLEPAAAEPAQSAEAGILPPLLNWQDQDELLRALWLRNLPPPAIADQLGRSVAAVMTRAVRLGLPRRAAPGRKPGRRLPVEARTTNAGTAVRTRAQTAAMDDAPAVEMVPRVCLMCLNKFPSAGRHNRICVSCKGSSEYAAASSIPEISLGGDS